MKPMATLHSKSGTSAPAVAIVSPHFPPATLAGVHRARHLAKHLPAYGWKPIIVRADEEHYTEQLDPALAQLVPETVEQVRTQAVPARIARMAGIGDIGLRGWFGFRGALDTLSKERRLKAVLITGSPYYPMLMARYIRQRLKLPVILDFQDPWVSAEGKLRTRWSKGGLAHKLAVWLEPSAVRHASWITSVSETQNAEMAVRYPWLDPSRMSALPIGGDPEDFAAMRVTPPPCTLKLEQGTYNICYVGTFLPRASSVVSAVFKGAAQLRQTHPDVARRLRFVFVGTSNQPGPTTRSHHRVWPLADAVGLGDITTEYPGRVGYLEALSLLAKADALLLLGSDEPHYTASKIYPALMSGTPYISVFHAASSSHRILTNSGGGVSFAFESTDQLATMTPGIADGLARLMTKPELLGRSDPSAFADYTAQAIASRFAAILDRLREDRIPQQ